MLGGFWVIKNNVATFEHVERTKGDYPAVNCLLLATGVPPDDIPDLPFHNSNLSASSK